MASGPDLFVVCKKCGSEVSPYITECPYCGTRLRKRAPKLERGGVAKEPKATRRRRPSLGRLKPGEIPGIRPDRRPYATIALVLASVLVTLGARADLWEVDRLVLLFNTTDEYYRTVTTLFVYGQTGYEVVALGATFLFGWLLERRHGWWAPLLVFLAGGAGGMFLAIASDDLRDGDRPRLASDEPPHDRALHLAGHRREQAAGRHRVAEQAPDRLRDAAGPAGERL